ncbi:MAG: alpha/beta hydrolase, partial [Flavisolibacter sp.]
MIRKTITTALYILVSTFAFAIHTDSLFTETPIVLHTATGDIFGTLTTPKTTATIPVALIIAGSGPTDRNGNNPMMKNESLRYLAYGLASNNIASLRFDKRGIAESKAAGKSEADLRFEDYINDAKQWIELL